MQRGDSQEICFSSAFLIQTTPQLQERLRMPLIANISGQLNTKENSLGGLRGGEFHVLQKTDKEDSSPRFIEPSPSKVLYESFSSATTSPY